MMVFFPGGNFVQGGSSTVLYNGVAPANATDVVIVVVNYRLGALAFFLNNQLEGNLGIQDQTMALLWVQKNIQAFGGDPSAVTIYGQSAGGSSVACQMVSPAANGLFQAAIMESNPILLTLNTKKEMTSISQTFAQLSGCSYEDLNCLRALNLSAVITAQSGARQVTFLHPLWAFQPWQPYVDGKVISGQPMELFKTGKYHQVPFMVGNVQDEGWLFIFSVFTSNLTGVEYKAIVDFVFLSDAAKVLTLYPPPPKGEDARPTLAVLGTDYIWVCPTRNVSRYMSALHPLYRYHFDHVLSFDPWGPNFAFCIDKCCHGSELPFVFNSAPLGGFSWDTDEAVLANYMVGNWGNFATNANPNTPYPVELQWPAFTQQNDQDMHFMTPQSAIEKGYRSQYCDLFDSIGYNHGVTATREKLFSSLLQSR